MTDTGTSCTYFPTEHYQEIINILKTLIPNWYIDTYGDIGIPCDEKSYLPTISFLYGGYWMEMRPEDWIVETDGLCWACLGENNFDEYWILGDTFLRGFYSVHDNANARFGFAPHAGSKKNAALRAEPLEL